MTHYVHKKKHIKTSIHSDTVYSLLRAKRFLQIEHFGKSPLLLLLVFSTMLLMELAEAEPTSWQNCDGDDCSSADKLSLLSIICNAYIRCELMMNGYERLYVYNSRDEEGDCGV